MTQKYYKDIQNDYKKMQNDEKMKQNSKGMHGLRCKTITKRYRMTATHETTTKCCKQNI